MSSYVPVKLAYNTFEPASSADGSLPPVLFLHGGMASKENWKDIPQIVADETKRKVYALDARNHGDSEWSDIFNFDVNTDDLFHFMESMNLPKAILIGHSMGGYACIRAALRKPEKVEKLIVEDLFVRPVPENIIEMTTSYISITIKAAKDVPPELDLEGAKKFILDRIHDSLPDDIKKELKDEDSDSHAVELKRNEDGHYVLKTNLEVIEKAMRNYGILMSDPEGIYEGPACFIYGTLSPFHVGDEEPHIKQFFPNAEFVCIQDATHTVHAEKPEEFTKAVLNFISLEEKKTRSFVSRIVALLKSLYQFIIIIFHLMEMQMALRVRIYVML